MIKKVWEENMKFSDLLKFFGSLQKIALILFLLGLSLILSNDEIRETVLLKDFINTYGVYIGVLTIASGIILLVFGIEKSFLFLRNRDKLSKSRTELIKILKNLSLDEKRVLSHFLAKNTQTSILGDYFSSIHESEPITVLMAKGFLNKRNIGLNISYQLNGVIWNVLQDNLREILYEDIFWKDENV